jgi:hypothetical protein
VTSPFNVLVHLEYCELCGKDSEMKVPVDVYNKWIRHDMADPLVSAVDVVARLWPESSIGKRIQLTTGCHPKCYNAAYPTSRAKILEVSS